MQTKQSVTNSNIRATVIAAFGVLSMVLAVSETAQAQANQPTPLVFQAAGPDATSIQGAVDAFRAALGDNNLNNPGPIQKGRREINWDGGNPNLLDTTPPVNPFLVFLNTRGSQYKTPGLGLSQAPPAGGPKAAWRCFLAIRTMPKSSRRSAGRGCSLLWGATSPKRRSPYRAAMAMLRQQSEASAQCSQMLTSQMERAPGAAHKGSTRSSTSTRTASCIFSSFVPAAPGDGSLSFFAIKFDDARIASVRITAGDVAPGPNDDAPA